MGKNAVVCLMKNIEHTMVGINPKQFFTLREGDTAYTLQRGSNSFGQFLLVSELKVGGLRRSAIIPGGRAQNGWKVFGLELRKMLEPDQYALGGSGQAKFVSQPQRRRSGFQPPQSFIEILKGQVQPRDVTQPQHITTKDKDKNMTQGEFVERQNQSRGLLAMNLKLTGAKELGQHGELPRVVDVTVDGGFHAEKSPVPVIQVRNQSSAMATGVDDCEIVVGQIETMGRLAKPLMVAKCTVSDGFSVKESSTILDKPDADLTH
ncbi:hypothetical protein SO802_029201 [Lithocarpus litseifolius]|uniref:Uncharacterized protein n=1 Tax=Lithocarpus litseifolius TaxID=425828 RepID=A0AAW2BT00_9ROSI